MAPTRPRPCRRAPRPALVLATGLAAAVGWAADLAAAAPQGYHRRAPNRYLRTAADNAATALDARLARGEIDLAAHGPRGRLRALLRALGIPESSQTLVFSKTSLQRHRVSPQNPRAIYFGPDAYVGWIPGAAALEIAVGDPALGLVFYTLSQDPAAPARLVRDDSCLDCHAADRTADEPGLLLRSVFPDAGGDPIASAGEAEVSTATPIAERWGGWLVTGRFDGAHRGNGTAVRDDGGDWRVPPRPAADLGAFADAFDPDAYPVATSDVGALLVLEHQVTVHNVLVRASMQMRFALAQEEAWHETTGETGTRPATERVAEALAREIAEALLLAHEPALADRNAAPDPAFAAAFAAQWPVDADGVRLGALDLSRRTFALPLSPMVHAPAFAALPEDLRRRALRRLFVAIEQGTPPGGVEMTTAERLWLRDHLRGTVPDWPEPRPRRR